LVWVFSVISVITVRRLFIVGVAVAGLVVPAAVAHAQAVSNRHTSKIDKALSEALNAGGATEHVIITLKPGNLAGMRRRLQDHGDVIQSEHASIDALAAEFHSA
jgi:hypothetical protein